MNCLDPNLISAVGLALNTLGISFQVYSTFKKNNTEIFFSKILNEDFSKGNIDKLLNKICSNNELKPQFHYIIDNVSSELIEEKIQLWANAYKNLSNDIYTNELFLKTFNNMTYLEYIALQSYSDNPQPINIHLEGSIIAKNKLVAMGLLINESFTGPFNYNSLKSKTNIKTEYKLSEFGTKMLKFLSGIENKI